MKLVKFLFFFLQFIINKSSNVKWAMKKSWKSWILNKLLIYLIIVEVEM